MAPCPSDSFLPHESQTLWEFVAVCNTVSSSQEFPSTIPFLRRFAPFEYYAFGVVGIHSHYFELVGTDFPIEFVRLYADYGLITDPALYVLRQSSAVIATSLDEPGLDRRQVDAVKSQYGIQRCLSVAMRGALGFTMYLAVSNYAQEDEDKLRNGLSLIAPTLLTVCDRLIMPWGADLEEGHAIADGLSPREGEVVLKMLYGKTNSEIGHMMGISERTVRFHVEEIVRKAGSSPRSWSPRIRLVVADSIRLSGFSSLAKVCSEKPLAIQSI